MSDEAADVAQTMAVSLDPSPEPPSRQSTTPVLAGLVATAPLAPVLGVATTVLLFMSAGPESRPVLWGFVSAVLLWVVGAVCVAPFMTMERANRSVYRSLVTRVNALETGQEPGSRETRDHVVRLGRELNVDISRSSVRSAIEDVLRSDETRRGDHA